jgi:predicted glycosyltransferase
MDAVVANAEVGNRKSVFVAALDWGLGHATRCIPIIRELQNQNVRVVLGGSGASMMLLKDEFPRLPSYELPSYAITYPKSGSLAFSMLAQWPRIIQVIKKERLMTDEIIEEEKIQNIISDNRYGCYSKHVKSIFVCHQLNIQMPRGFSWLSRPINTVHKRMIKNFDQVWVPDQTDGFSFSGILSQSALGNVKRVGILSRFGEQQTKEQANDEANEEEGFVIVALISGPEPQRSVLEEMVRHQLQTCGRKSLLVLGRPGTDKVEARGRMTEASHLSSEKLETVLRSAKVVLARPGYSTVMDLAALGKQAIFVPTPGQTEQEYLGQYLMSKGVAVVQAQAKFDLSAALAQLPNFKPLPKTIPNSSLSKAVQELLRQ